MVRIILNGYNGRMGKVICGLAEHSEEVTIVAGIELNPPNTSVPFPTYTHIADCDMPADCIIDFSSPSSLQGLLDYSTEKKACLILCTTGYTKEDTEKISEYSKSIPIFFSFNMSLGINLIGSMLTKISKVLYSSGFDIEIVEKHHNQKLDAPSGTALMLLDCIQNGIDDDLKTVTDRSQTRSKREKAEIGVHAVRGGTIVGDHSVIFAGKDEVIELKHNAQSKEVFAVGALRASIFMKGKPHGLYSMQDMCKEVLGL